MITNRSFTVFLTAPVLAVVSLFTPNEVKSEQQSSRDYEVVVGDTLWDLSKRFLGRGSDFKRIFEANRANIDNPDVIFPGQTISFPSGQLGSESIGLESFANSEASRLFQLEEGLRDGLEIGFEESDALKIALGVLEVPENVELASLETQKRKQLEYSLAAATIIGEPTSWHGGVFVSSSIISSVLSSLEEVKFGYSGENKNLQGAEVAISSANLATKDGFLVATLGVLASRGKYTVGITLNASIEFDRFEGTGENSRSAIFKLTPIDITPKVEFDGVSVRHKALWVNVLPTLLDWFGGPSSFEFPVPIHSVASFEFGIDRETTNVIDDEKNRSLTYTTQLNKRKINLVSTVAAPVFTTNGIYFVSGPSVFNEIGTARAQVEERSLSFERLNQEIDAKVSSWGFSEDDVEIFVGADFLQSAIAEIGMGPQENRTINVQSTKVTGKLAEDKWSDDFLGRGGVWAAFNGNNAVNASLTWSNLSASFADQSIKLTAPLNFKGNAGVKFHFDPLIGGGIGTSIGMNTSSSATVQLTATSGFKRLNDVSFGFLSVIPKCGRIKADIESDGRFKVGKSWASIPTVGARLQIPIGKEPLFQDAIFVTQSEVIDLGSDPFKVGDWQPEDRVFGGFVSAVPTRFEFGRSGIRAATSVNLSLFSPQEDRDEVDNLKRVSLAENNRVKNLANDWVATNGPRAACDLETEVAVLLGDVEIGRNNEVAKLVANAINDAWEGPGKNNEVRRILREEFGIDVELPGVKDIWDGTVTALEAGAEALPQFTFKQNGHVEIKTPLGTIGTGGGHGGLGLTVPGIGGDWKL